MKGYKAFEPGLVCRGKQYAENTVFEEDSAEICKSGMHFCAAPLDVLDYYPLINDNGELNEFAEVEALDETKTDGRKKKYTTKKLKIGAKVSIKRLGELHTEYVREVVKVDGGANGGNYAKQVGGDHANQVGGNYASQVGGDGASQVGGDDVKQVGGYSVKQVGGDHANQVGGNYASQVGGDGASQVGGDDVKQVGGYSVKQVGGYGAKQVGGNSAKQVGDNCVKQVGGKNSVMVAGEGSRFKAGINSVIVHYWYDDDGNIVGFKAAQIDGVTLLPNTWYKLENGEFIKAE